MSEWDEIDNIKVDAKNDMLMQAFEYAYRNKVDTVELEIEFNKGMAIKATVTFDLPDREVEEHICETCEFGIWKRNGWDVTMADDECGGCCSLNDKWQPIRKIEVEHE